MELRPIEGFANRYAVSRCGKVVRLPDTVMPTHLRDGYERATLYNTLTKTKLNQSVHRLVAKAWLGIPEDPAMNEVNHIDGDKTNNHLDNLEWLTREANLNHYQLLLLRQRRAQERISVNPESI